MTNKAEVRTFPSALDELPCHALYIGNFFMLNSNDKNLLDEIADRWNENGAMKEDIASLQKQTSDLATENEKLRETLEFAQEGFYRVLSLNVGVDIDIQTAAQAGHDLCVEALNGGKDE